MTLRPEEEGFVVPLPDGATIAISVHGRGPRLLVSHGNGFAVEAYRDFWSLLTDRYQVVAFDQRHHGRSSPYRHPLRNIPQLIEDFGLVLAAIEDRLGPADTYGAFHSLSALVSLMHATGAPAPWRGLVAFEPPILPPPESGLLDRFLRFNKILSDSAARRRDVFDSPDELAGSFAKHDAFRRVPDAARRRLAAATLRPRADGGFELSCARAFEAETFKLHGTENAWNAITQLRIPLCLVGSDPAADGTSSLPHVARAIAAQGSFAFRSVPDTTHFLQFEQPDACAAIVHDFISSLGAPADRP